MQVDRVSGLQIAWDGFRPNPGQRDLPLWIVRVAHVHVQRDLTVDAHRLYLLDNCGLGAL